MNQNQDQDQAAEFDSSSNGGNDSEQSKSNARVKKDEMLQKLQKEREVLEKLDNCPLALKLVMDEISRINSGRQDPVKVVDLNRDIPVNLHVRVKIPYKEFPKFNFVGRLLGPRGTSLQKLQQETITKMTVGGRGCMKDKAKEEELRQSNDPKFAHLHEELHLDVHSYASPAEAYARMAYALAELRKFLIPVSDKSDDISQAQLRQMELINSGGSVGMRSPYGGGPRSIAPIPPPPPPMTAYAAGIPNGMPGGGAGGSRLSPMVQQQQNSSEMMRHKVMAILDKARKNQMDFAAGNAGMGYSYGLGEGYYAHEYPGAYPGHGAPMGLPADQRRAAMWL